MRSLSRVDTGVKKWFWFQPSCSNTGRNKHTDPDVEQLWTYCAAAHLLIDGAQVSVLPQHVQHLSGRLHHLHRVSAANAHAKHTKCENHWFRQMKIKKVYLYVSTGEVLNDYIKDEQALRLICVVFIAVTYLSPLPLVMLTSFSMPPASARALAFSMFLLVTSCRVQQIAATVSSDSCVVFPPGKRFTRSRMAYFPEIQPTSVITLTQLGLSIFYTVKLQTAYVKLREELFSWQL